MIEPVIISKGELEAKINPSNGQLHELSISGKQIIAEYKKGHTAPILAPIHGKVHEDRILINGESFPMFRHGFARDYTWEVCKQEDNLAWLAQTYEANTPIKTEKGEVKFPFDFTLEAVYHLMDKQLSVVHGIRNDGSENNLLICFGWHPVYLKDPSKEVELIERGSNMDPEKFGDALLYKTHNLFFRQGDLEIETFTTMPYILVWQPKDRDVIGIEVWNGKPDTDEEVKELKDLNGIITIEPEDIKTFDTYITPRIKSPKP